METLLTYRYFHAVSVAIRDDDLANMFAITHVTESVDDVFGGKCLAYVEWLDVTFIDQLE